MEPFDILDPQSEDTTDLPWGGVRTTPAERRRNSRVEICLPVRYRFPQVADASWAQGLVLNLSETGGAFLVDGAWPHAERVDGDDGFRVELEIGDPYGGTALRLAGGVVWVRPDGGGAEGIDRIGVRFTDPSDADMAQLEQMLAD